MEPLNNRELAICVWVAFALIFAVFKPDIRTSISKALKTLFSLKLITPFLLLAVYVTVCVSLLNIIGLWKTHQIKNTLIWFITVGSISFLKLNESLQDDAYFKKLILKNIKVLVILQFIFSFYVFSFVVEFIAIPIIFSLGGMQAIANSKEEFRPAAKALDTIFVLLSMLIILITLYKLVTRWDEFAQIKTLYDLFVPTALSVLIVPYLFILSLYMRYEGVFINLKRHLGKDTKVLRHAKRASVVRFLFKPRLLQRWSNNLHNEEIVDIEGVDKSIDELYRLIETEKNPPPVAREDGWSPYAAIKFLDEHGVKTGHYHQIKDFGWSASSLSMPAGGGYTPNTIEYHIDGSSTIASKLLLVLNIFPGNEKTEAVNRYLVLTRKLFNVAIGKELPETISRAIIEPASTELNIDSYRVSVTKNEWLSGKGYYMELSIEKM
ncbi:MAG: hypothetical protein AB2L13_09785 [Spirochaetota bacterium]|jgi:hypothetical protein